MMKVKAAIFSLPVLALALMGQSCPNQDAQIRNALATWCPAIDTADAHYQAVKVYVSVRTQAKVDAVVGQFKLICAGQATATTVTILAQGAVAAHVIADALKEARNKNASVAYTADYKALDKMLKEVQKQ